MKIKPWKEAFDFGPYLREVAVPVTGGITEK